MAKINAFQTSALDGGEWPASLSDCYNPWDNDPVPTGQDYGWTKDAVFKRCRIETKSMRLPRIESRSTRP